MCYTMSRYDTLAYGYESSCIGFEIQDFTCMESRLSRDIYLNSHGAPYEIGFAHLLVFDYRSCPRHPSANVGISSLTYEFSLILCQLKTFLSCHVDLCINYLKDTDLSVCYMPVDSSLVPLALKHSQYMHLNDAYENIIRFMCGAGQHDVNEMFSFHLQILTHLQRYLSRDSQYENDDSSESFVHSQTYRFHRLVSNIRKKRQQT